MAQQRLAKEITDKNDIDFLLNMTEEDCFTTSTLMEILGDFGEGPRFNPYDYFKVPTNSYGPEKKRNKKPFYTSVGLWIFNKGFIEKELFDLFQYVNSEFTTKQEGKMNDVLSYAVLEERIPISALKNYEIKIQKMMPFVTILSPSYTVKMLTITKDINKKKAELAKKYKTEIENQDEKAMDVIEKELLAYAADLLDGDPSMDMYNSGARGSFNNNFKNMFVSKGAIRNPDPTKGFDLALSNYMEGISKEDYPVLASSLSAGPYSRAKKTETGGYWEKLFGSAFQHVILLDAGSDCGTTRTITVTLTEKNIDSWMYSYIKEGTRLIELTSDMRSKYIGKTVKMRYSSMCESKDGICNKCMGNLPYRLGGVKNIGITTEQIPSRIKVALLKQFHNSTIRFVEMDIEKAFGFKK